MVDLGFMKDKVLNDNKIGFLLFVDVYCQLLHVEPIASKTMASLEEAIKRTIERSPMSYLKLILSDRESALWSTTFASRMEARGIRLHFLTKPGNHAYLAERYIAYVRRRLMLSMKAAGSRRWIEFLPTLLVEYNSRKVPGTPYRRTRITPRNFFAFMEQLWRVSDWSSVINVAQLSGDRLSASFPAWTEKVFKFRTGDAVLIDRRVDPTALQKTTAGTREEREVRNFNIFSKSTERGYFGGTIYFVHSRCLRSTRDFVLFPLYRCCRRHYISPSSAETSSSSTTVVKGLERGKEGESEEEAEEEEDHRVLAGWYSERELTRTAKRGEKENANVPPPDP